MAGFDQLDVELELHEGVPPVEENGAEHAR
jgi:hypothetical protein